MGRRQAWGDREQEIWDTDISLKLYLHIITNWMIVPGGLMREDVSSCPVRSDNNTAQRISEQIANYAAPDSLQSHSHEDIVTFSRTGCRHKLIQLHGILDLRVCVCACHRETDWEKKQNSAIWIRDVWRARVCCCACMHGKTCVTLAQR